MDGEIIRAGEAPALSVLAERINHGHKCCLMGIQTAVEGAIDAGLALIEAKSLVGHGSWLPWIEANCACGVRMAQKYMRVARGQLEGKYEQSSHSTIEGALQALAAPEPKPEPEPDIKSKLDPDVWLFPLLPQLLLERCVTLIESDDDYMVQCGIQEIESSKLYRPYKSTAEYLATKYKERISREEAEEMFEMASLENGPPNDYQSNEYVQARNYQVSSEKHIAAGGTIASFRKAVDDYRSSKYNEQPLASHIEILILHIQIIPHALNGGLDFLNKVILDQKFLRRYTVTEFLESNWWYYERMEETVKTPHYLEWLTHVSKLESSA